MKKNPKYEQTIAFMRTLTEAEKDFAIWKLMVKMRTPKDKAGVGVDNGSHSETIVTDALSKKPDCPHCGAKADLGYIVKAGKRKGMQSYRCRSCGRIFSSTTHTAFAHTRKSMEVWLKFIEMTFAGKSIAACAKECGMCIQTAFDWRHKILDAFIDVQNDISASGRIDIDDGFVPVDFNDNNIKDFFGFRVSPISTTKIMPDTINSTIRNQTFIIQEDIPEYTHLDFEYAELASDNPFVTAYWAQKDWPEYKLARLILKRDGNFTAWSLWETQLLTALILATKALPRIPPKYKTFRHIQQMFAGGLMEDPREWLAELYPYLLAGNAPERACMALTPFTQIESNNLSDKVFSAVATSVSAAIPSLVIWGQEHIPEVNIMDMPLENFWFN